nr:hypothetical protein CFP56_08233 [Quercus suber]
MGPSASSKRTLPKDVACCLILLSTKATFRVNLYFPPSKIDSGKEDVRASPPNEVPNFWGSIKGPNLVPQTLILCSLSRVRASPNLIRRISSLVEAWNSD